MQELELAKWLNEGSKSQENLVAGRTRTYSAIALSDSSDGKVFVDMGGDSVTVDDSQGIEISCGPQVKKGDRVIVSIVNGYPCVSNVAGWGDELVADVEESIDSIMTDIDEISEVSEAAKTAADNALEITELMEAGIQEAEAVAAAANQTAQEASNTASDAADQAAAASQTASTASTQATTAYNTAVQSLQNAQAAQNAISILDASTSTSLATLFSATHSDNLLSDTSVSTRYKVRGPADRYWSDSTSSSYITCSLVKVADSPVSDVDIACKFTANGNQTSTKSRRLTWYDGQSVPLREGSSYVLSCWAYADSPSNCFVSLQVGTPVSPWKGQNSSQALASGWRRYEWRFTYKAAVHGDAPRVYVGASFAKSKAGSVYVCGPRLTCADEWDEVSTIIRQTAEGLLVASVGSRVGALVSAAGQFTVNNLTWNSSGPVIGTPMASFNGESTAFFDSAGRSIGTFGTSGSVIGRTDGTQRNVYVGPEGVLLREGKVNIASFTKSGTVFYADGKKRSAYSAAGCVFYGADGTTEQAVFGTSARIGPSTGQHLCVDGGGMTLDNGSTRMLSITPSAFVIGNTTGKHLGTTSKGIGLYNGTKLIAEYGNRSAQIGPSDDIHAVIVNNSFDIASGDATPVKLISMNATSNASHIESTQRPLKVGYFKKTSNATLNSYIGADANGIGMFADNPTASRSRYLQVKNVANSDQGLIYNGKYIGHIIDYGTVGPTQYGGDWWWAGLPDGRWLVQGRNPSLSLNLSMQWGASGLWGSDVLQTWTPPDQVPGRTWISADIGFIGGWGAVSYINGRTVAWRALGSARYVATGMVWISGVMVP